MKASQAVLTSAVVAILVIGIGLGLYYTLPSLNIRGTTTEQSTTSSYSVQDSNTTSANTMIRANTTTITTLSSTSTSTSNASVPAQGSFTNSPSSVVKILSVEAYTSQYGPGNQSISFVANFQNVGNNTIYVIRGGGSGLNATILSGNVTQVSTIRCEIAEAPSPISPGSNSTATTPGCWSGYDFVMSHPGTIKVQLTLSWSYGMSSQQTTSDVITAEFNLN